MVWASFWGKNNRNLQTASTDELCSTSFSARDTPNYSKSQPSKPTSRRRDNGPAGRALRDGPMALVVDVGDSDDEARCRRDHPLSDRIHFSFSSQTLRGGWGHLHGSWSGRLGEFSPSQCTLLWQPRAPGPCRRGLCRVLASAPGVSGFAGRHRRAEQGYAWVHKPRICAQPKTLIDDLRSTRGIEPYLKTCMGIEGTHESECIGRYMRGL